ncbi:MAG: class I SAM-dependent methyltransferase [Gammaproteobacteria bacterium]
MSSLEDIAINKCWCNEDNQTIYENMPLDDLEHCAHLVGIAHGEDIDQIQRYLYSAKNILEIGAGYGRVIRKLLADYPRANITAIERITKYADYLKQTYPEVNVVNENIFNVTFTQKYDVILLMWSTFGEFSRNEQGKLLNYLLSQITPKGVIFIELWKPMSKHVYANKVIENNVEYKSVYGNHYVYIPRKKELITFARKNLISLKTINYKNSTNEERVIFCFHNNKTESTL